MPPLTQPELKDFARWAFWLWAPVPVVVVGLLMGGHLLTLAPPTAQALRALRVPGTGWRVLHVLALKCPCSRQVIDHLIGRGASPGFYEKILFIGEDEAIAKRARAAGFQFESLGSAEVEARYGIRGAPLLVVVNPEDQVLYSGGYARQQRGPPEDLAIFAALIDARVTEPRPLYGCAVAKALQKQLDPLGLKYSPADP